MPWLAALAPKRMLAVVDSKPTVHNTSGYRSKLSGPKALLSRSIQTHLTAPYIGGNFRSQTYDIFQPVYL